MRPEPEPQAPVPATPPRRGFQRLQRARRRFQHGDRRSTVVALLVLWWATATTAGSGICFAATGAHRRDLRKPGRERSRVAAHCTVELVPRVLRPRAGLRDRDSRRHRDGSFTDRARHLRSTVQALPSAATARVSAVDRDLVAGVENQEGSGADLPRVLRAAGDGAEECDDRANRMRPIRSALQNGKWFVTSSLGTLPEIFTGMRIAIGFVDAGRRPRWWPPKPGSARWCSTRRTSCALMSSSWASS